MVLCHKYRCLAFRKNAVQNIPAFVLFAVKLADKRSPFSLNERKGCIEVERFWYKKEKENTILEKI